MIRVLTLSFLGLAFLAACGGRSDGASVSGRAPVTTAASADAGCATLLPGSVRPDVFVLPQDSWVQQRQSILQCDLGTGDSATSDALGNLAFSVQTRYGNTPADARLYVMNPVTGAIQVDDVPGTAGPWLARAQGLEEGFLGSVEFIAPQDGYHLVWYDHSGVPTGARHDSGPGPGRFLSVLPDGRVIVLNAPRTPQEGGSLEEHESDGVLRWATALQLPTFPLLATVDLDGRTLLVGDWRGDGRFALRWADEDGVLGPVFDAPPELEYPFARRAEGGFFLQQAPGDWVGMLASGSTMLEPAPDWLPPIISPAGGDRFRVTPARDGYLIRSSDSPHSILEVRTAAGELCGHVDLIPVDGRIQALGASTVGADGTVFVSGYSCTGSSKLAASLQANAGSQVCACAWQYWPALLH